MNDYPNGPETFPVATTSLQTAEVLVPTNEALVRKVKAGAGWLWLIAGLSVANLVLTHFEAPIRFAVGLGATDLVYEIGQDLNPVLGYAALAVDAVAIGILVYLGFRAKAFRVWAFVTALALMLSDTGILLWLSWLNEELNLAGLMLHLAAMYFLVVGLRAARLHNRRKEISDASAQPSLV